MEEEGENVVIMLWSYSKWVVLWYMFDVIFAQEGSVELMAPNEVGDEFT
jgi:hypothetical protein